MLHLLSLVIPVRMKTKYTTHDNGVTEQATWWQWRSYIWRHKRVTL